MKLLPFRYFNYRKYNIYSWECMKKPYRFVFSTCDKTYTV